MSSQDKDFYQKFNAIKFCIATGSLPFLEVNVGNRRELSSKSTIITDVDVLGISIDSTGKHKKTIYDCKTLGKTSPINRAFWLAGLMKYISCEDGYIILSKKSDEAHKLSARSLNVYLFDDEQFLSYMKAYSIESNLDYCYGTDLRNWISQYEVYKKHKKFTLLGAFLNNELPSENDSARAIRRILVGVSRVKGEFNPANNDHVSIFYNSILLFSLHLSRILQDLKTVINYDSDKESFDNYLKYYIWGGFDSFEKKRKIKKAFGEINENSEIGYDPELNEWDSFVNLVSIMLESPNDVFKCCFIARELSFRYLSDVDDVKDDLIKTYCKNNNRIKQFMLLVSDYLIQSCSLPKDFKGIIYKDLEFK